MTFIEGLMFAVIVLLFANQKASEKRTADRVRWLKLHDESRR